MMKNALKMAALPAALMTATPGSAAVDMVDSTWSWTGPAVPLQLSFAKSGLDRTEGAFSYGWTSPEWGPLTVSIDPAKRAVVVQSGPTLPSLGLAASMPEPMSWAMMLVGLGVVGWTMRGRQRHSLRHISFV